MTGGRFGIYPSKRDRTITSGLPANRPVRCPGVSLKAAVEKLIVEHARLGRPIYIWRNGEVVEVSGEELRELAARIEAD